MTEDFIPQNIRSTRDYMHRLTEGQTKEVTTWILENLAFAVAFMVAGDYVMAENLVFGTKDLLIAKGLLKPKRSDEEEPV